jgi:hypothetical protein
MKTFTAKQFSRNPAQVFDAAREYGRAVITHGGYLSGQFVLEYQKKADEFISEEYLTDFNKRMAKAIRSEMDKRNEKGPEGPDSDR